MSNLLWIINSHSPFKEESDLASQLPNWNFHFEQDGDLSLYKINQHIRREEIHFLLLTREWESKFIDQTRRISHENPLLTIIYSNAQLRDLEFAELYRAGINYCIIGDARFINLVRTLNELWDNHWRRVPQHLISHAQKNNATWLKDTLNFIEKRPIKQFNVHYLSKYFNVSENQFRAEFKIQFGESFRTFKQQLFQHYEDILLFEKKLKPKEVYRYLSYKNLSAFSRSFKTRHGRSWQEYMRNPVR